MDLTVLNLDRTGGMVTFGVFVFLGQPLQTVMGRVELKADVGSCRLNRFT